MTKFVKSEFQPKQPSNIDNFAKINPGDVFYVTCANPIFSQYILTHGPYFKLNDQKAIRIGANEGVFVWSSSFSEYTYYKVNKVSFEDIVEV